MDLTGQVTHHILCGIESHLFRVLHRDTLAIQGLILATLLILLAFDDLIIQNFVEVKLHTSALLKGAPLSEEVQTEDSHDLAVLVVDTALVWKQQVEYLEDAS